MVRSLFGFILFCLLATTGFAQQPIAERAVPEQIRDDFQYRFLDAQNVVWLKDGNTYYGASFMFRKARNEAIYDADGNWVQTKAEYEFTALPEEAQKYCRAYFAGAKIKDVHQISSRRYGIMYNVKVMEDLRNYKLSFDQHGTLVEEVDMGLEVAEQPQEKKKLNLGGLLKKKSSKE